MSRSVRPRLLAPALVALALAPGVARADDSAAETSSGGVSQHRCEPPAGVDPYSDPSLARPNAVEAERHRQNGKAYHRAGNFERAIEEFQAGLLVESAPVFLYSLGQSHRVAGNYEKAIYTYRLFLDHGQPEQVLRELVECNVAMMQGELDRAAMTSPPLDLPSDDRADDRAGVEESARPSARWYSDRLGWTFLGAGTLAAAAGGLLILDAADLREQSAREDREEVRDQLRARSDSRRTWGIVVTSVGVVALAVGVVRLVFTPDAPAPLRSARGVDLAVGPGTLGLAGRF